MSIIFQLITLSLVFFKCIVFCEDEILNKGTLIFSTVVFRHGDRMPVEAYKNDPHHNASEWPAGWGQLSNLGKQQHYALGKWLRKRYNGTLISEKYLESEIYVQSSDLDRTLMSATANMAGLYTPRGDQIWNPYLEWQPVPVHTIPEELDTLILTTKSCPLYDEYYAQLLKSDHIQLIEKKFSTLFEYLSKHSGNTIHLDNWSILNLYDTLTIQQIYNKTLPDWTRKVFPHGDFEHLSYLTFAFETFTPQMARLKYGVLLKEILVRFQNKTKSQLVPDRSMWVYSGHDTTLSGLLNCMGMFKIHAPPYASTLLFELRAHNNVSYVSIFYKNSTATPEPMFIPDCGVSCPLDKMFKLFENSMPSRDHDEECKITTSPAAQLPRDEIVANLKGIAENVKSNGNSYLISFILPATSCIFLFSLY